MKNDKLPLVSIITPVYNRADLVGETIESILSQDYQKIEHILIDDGSTDQSLKVIQKYKSRNHSRKKIIIKHHRNMGEARTVNKGFKIAKGAIIGVVNSDDPLLAGAISQIVKFMLAHPKIIVVYPDWVTIDDDGKKTGIIRTANYSYLDMLRGHHCIPGPGAFFRREVAEKLNGRDPQFRYVGDYDFWLRAGRIGPFARIPKLLATFRVHKGAVTVKDVGVAMSKEHLELFKKVYSQPKITDGMLKIKNEALSSAYYTAAAAMGNANPALRKRYFIKAFLLYPVKYFGEYRLRLLIILSVVFFGSYILMQFFNSSTKLLKKILGRKNA